MLKTSLAGHEAVLQASGALHLPAFKTLLVADAHFGKAAGFRLLGVPVPEATTDGTLDALTKAVDAAGAEHVVFLGDFLHSRRSHQKDVLASLARWRDAHARLALTLVRGNHDDRAGDPPPSLGMRVVDEPFELGPFALCHHPRAVPGRYTLAGHWHPCITVRGRALDRLRLPCFWFGAEARGSLESRANGDASSAGIAAPDAAAMGAASPLQDGGFARAPRGVGILPAFGSFTGMHKIDCVPGDRVFAIAGEAVRELPEACLG